MVSFWFFFFWPTYWRHYCNSRSQNVLFFVTSRLSLSGSWEVMEILKVMGMELGVAKIFKVSVFTSWSIRPSTQYFLWTKRLGRGIWIRMCYCVKIRWSYIFRSMPSRIFDDELQKYSKKLENKSPCRKEKWKNYM